MKSPLPLFFALSAAISSPLLAQWKTETFSLKGGWSSIYLHGDADYATIDEILNSGDATNIREIWRWNANPEGAQFTTSNQVPSVGTPDWSVWRRGDPTQNDTTFNRLRGQTAYLVYSDGTSSQSYTVPLKYKPTAPDQRWVRNGANLIGLPARADAPPTITNYFSTFPAAIASNSRIFQYEGGELGPANPIQIFAPAAESLNRSRAYWFESAAVSRFHGPLDVEVVGGDGFYFGTNRNLITLRLKNLSNSIMNVTLEPLSSESAPTGQMTVTGNVPLTLRTLNPATLQYDLNALAGSTQLTISAGATLEVGIGIDRAAAPMAGATPGDFFASILRIRDDQNFSEIDLPVSGSPTSLEGLWLGYAKLTNVSSVVSNSASATATVTGTAVTQINVNGTGGFGYEAAPTVTIAPPAEGGTQATAQAFVSNGAVTSISVINPGSGYQVTPAVTVAAPPPLSNTAVSDAMSLRLILHHSPNGVSRLLSQVFVGPLEQTGQMGLCSVESLLDPDQKGQAARYTVAHLPLDKVISNGSGNIAVPGVMSRIVTIAYDDPTNPFVHQYHPDHDNLDARFAPLPAGVESPDITRTCSFTFTEAAPAGVTQPLGWGSSVIGGTYREVLQGLHQDTIQLDGTFTLQRVSEDGNLVTP